MIAPMSAAEEQGTGRGGSPDAAHGKPVPPPVVELAAGRPARDVAECVRAPGDRDQHDPGCRYARVSSTAPAARSPERTAPSMRPCMVVAHSDAAQ